MQIIRKPADDVSDPDLRQLIDRVFATVIDCPEILGFILIVEPGDTIAMLDAKLGFSILSGRHECILEHADWFELVYVLGQDGSGLEVIIPKSIDIPELLTMCQQHATPAGF
ncbi:MAG TPA: hypothetical protein PLB25_16915 [Rhodoferax sp.]|mgnify:FL=1|nr:hypothetical protein [Rhodoferax sp.]